MSIEVFCLQNLCLLVSFADQVFIDPTFGIFVCGPLQSFGVNVFNNRSRGN